MYWFTWKNNWFFPRGSPLFSFPSFLTSMSFHMMINWKDHICATKKYTSAGQLQLMRNVDRNENKNMNDIYSKRWLRTTKEICRCLEVHICHLSRILEVHICHRKRPWRLKLKSIIWKSNSQFLKIFRIFKLEKSAEKSISLRQIGLKTFPKPL